ncbi:MAG: heparinase II/III family protein [Verrucomicrobiales bacterium]|nr:heparinase II/III family protein [Verrucomicrobiales bacterium]
MKRIWQGTMLAVMGSLSTGTAEAQEASPAAAELLTKLRAGHPRLMVTQAEFDAARALTVSNPRVKKWRDDLAARAEKILREPPSKYEIPDGLRLLSTSRRVLERVRLLALMWQFGGEQKYADRAWAELSAAAAFPDWNPKHFLDTAEMTCAFATGYDWLHAAWSPEQRELLKNAMVEKGLRPALTVYRQGGWWTKSRFNWNQVCNGGIAIGALALADVEPELCGEILRHALKSLPLALTSYAPDGAWAEGPGYWNYATSYTVSVIAALESALGTDGGLSRSAGFDQTGEFPLYFTAPNGLLFNYADVPPGKFNGAAELFWLARKFDRPLLAARQLSFADQRPSPLNLLWGAAWAERDDLPLTVSLPRTRYFAGAEIAMLRGAWDDPLAVSVGFKAGDNKASHSHLDLGSFVLDALGHRWAEDLGRDDYNLPGYFGRERWNYYRLRAEGHNTLVINPTAAADQDPQAVAKIIRFETTSGKTLAIADLTAAYARHGARSVTRGVVLHDDKRVLVQDKIVLDQPGEIWWFMHTRAKVELTADGDGAILSFADGSKLNMWVGRQSAKSPLTVMDAWPLPASPQPAKQGENKGVTKLALHWQDTAEVTVSVWFYAFNGQTAPGIFLVEEKPLEQW